MLGKIFKFEILLPKIIVAILNLSLLVNADQRCFLDVGFSLKENLINSKVTYMPRVKVLCFFKFLRPRIRYAKTFQHRVR